MSLRRAVILSVTVERLSQADTARLYGVSRGFVSKLLARYRAEGDAAFEPRSRRPRNSPTALRDDVVELIVNLRAELADQALKRWLAAQSPAETLADLQELLDKFVVVYNEHRPHRSLDRRTPAIVYNLLPKAAPGEGGAGAHIRVRYDRVDVTGSVSLRRAGRMHHLGLGRAHGGQRVVLLIADLDIRVVNHDTGELVRHLQLDPTRGYQPRHK